MLFLVGYFLVVGVLYWLLRNTGGASIAALLFMMPAVLRLGRRPLLVSYISVRAASWLALVSLVLMADVIGVFRSLFRPAPTPVEVRTQEDSSRQNKEMVNLMNGSQSADIEELESALRSFDELVALGVPQQKILNFKARALIRLKRFEEGKELFQKWLTFNPGAEAISEYARALYDTHQYQEALEAYEAAFTQGQRCADLGAAGLCAIALGKKQLAEEYGQRSASCQGPGPAQQLGWALKRRPDFSVVSIQASGLPFAGQSRYQIVVKNSGGQGDDKKKIVEVEVNWRGKTVASQEIAFDDNLVKVKLPEEITGEISIKIDPKDKIWELQEDNNELTVEI